MKNVNKVTGKLALRCSACGSFTEATCGCGVGYVPAGEYAAKAVADPANASKSARQIAREIGISDSTVREALKKSGARNHAPETSVTGKDGKSYKARKAEKTNAAGKAIDQILARGEKPDRGNVSRESHTGELTARLALAEHLGAQKMKAELIEEEVVKAAEAALPKTSKEKLDRVLRYRDMHREAEFEARVQAVGAKQFDELVRPHFEAKEKIYNDIIAAYQGVFTKEEFNKILKCLHPDRRNAVTDAELAEAFQLFKATEDKLVRARRG